MKRSLSALAAGLILSAGIAAPAAAQEAPPAPPADGSHLVPEGAHESTPEGAPAPETDPEMHPEPEPQVDETINPNPPVGNGQTVNVQWEHEGKMRRYLMRVPDNYNPQHPAPILFGFGGWQDSPENFSSYARMWTTNAHRDAIIIYPEGYERAWEAAPYAKTGPGEDIRFLKRIIDAVDADYHIDRNRIYAMGMSNGGGFTSVLGCHAQDTFAAVAMVSAAFYKPVEIGCGDKPIATFIMHGVNDEMMMYEGGTRHKAEFLPVRTVLGGYLNRNKCDMSFRAEPAPGGSERLHFNNCQRETQLLKVPDIHTWFWAPDAANEVWDFLSRQNK